MKKCVFIVCFAATLSLLSQSLFAQYFCPVPKGTIQRAYVEYENSGWVTIKTGYGECNGEYWEILTEKSHEMTTLTTAEGFHYIYIDDSASTYPEVEIIDSTTEPAWSDAKQGWYNGDDRCIGAVWSPSGSAIVAEFSTDGEGKYIYDTMIKYILNNGAPTGSWEFLDASDYTPVNANGILLWTAGQDVNATGRATVASSDNVNNVLTIFGYFGFETAGWIFFQPGSDRDLQWWGYNDDEDLFRIMIYGYKIMR